MSELTLSTLRSLFEAQRCKSLDNPGGGCAVVAAGGDSSGDGGGDGGDCGGCVALWYSRVL